jgi:hypothetical protein
VYTRFTWDQKTVEEQEYAFMFNIFEASLLYKDCPYFVVSGCLHAVKYYMNECEIKPSLDIQKRAVVLVEKASN